MDLHFGNLKLIAPDSSSNLKRREFLAVAQGLGNVEACDLFASIEVGERSRDAQHPV
jgi:hypothetical protein